MIEAETELARLYAIPPDRFVAERDAVARRLRAEGRSDDAKRVRRTRKPPFAVWVANRLAAKSPAEVRSLAEAAERMAAGDAGAGERFRSALGTLLAAVPEIVAEAGRRPSDATLQRVLTTLRSAAGDPRARAAFVEARLADTPRPSGFDSMRDASGRGGSRRARLAGRRARTRSDEAARRALAEARARARALERRAEVAEREAQRVRSRAQRAAEQVRRAEERVATRASS